MLKVWLSPPGFAEKCSATSGRFDRAASDVRVARRPRIDGQGESPPGVDRSLVRRAVGVQKSAARERAHFRPAEALEQRHAPIKIGVSSGFGADQDQL